MKALSIRQPWAWLIIHAGKDIENRVWPTKVRGRVLVHAAKGCTRDEYDEACMFASMVDAEKAGNIPPLTDLQRGGIVGSVEIVGCVQRSDSRWFMGQHGFVLCDPRPLPFLPYTGKLGFFDVPDHLLQEAA